MKRIFIAFLSLLLIISMVSCKPKPVEVVEKPIFEDKPVWAFNSIEPPSYSAYWDATAQFEHSIFPYIKPFWVNADDAIAARSEIMYCTFSYGHSAYNLENLASALGTDSIPCTYIFVENESNSTDLLRVNKEFFTPEFKYDLLTNNYNFHLHLSIPHEFYCVEEKGEFAINVYYSLEEIPVNHYVTPDMLELFISVKIYYERHGDEVWISNSKEYLEKFS